MTTTSSTTPTTAMMKALAVNHNFTALDAVEIPKPSSVAKDQVLVKVQYSALDTAFQSIVTKDFFAGFIHNMKAKPLVLGYHYAGTIQAAGDEVENDFKVGQHVFGFLQYEPKQTQGAFSEYIVVAATECAVVPDGVSMPVAAASSTEALTALQMLRDHGKFQTGQSVLVVGVGGGVGSAAVGIARALGALHITAICSTKDYDRVKTLGADQVVDRREQSIFKLDRKYDVVLDASNQYSFRKHAMRHWLSPQGIFVNALPNIVESYLLGWLWPLITQQRLETVQCWSNKADLDLIGQWIAEGTVRIDLDSEYRASQFAEAWKRQESPKKTGRVVIQIENGW